MKNVFDVVVVGAGSGGLTSAVGFSKVGKKVLLIEKDEMGGECTNSGCIPSKALLHHAKQYYTAKKLSGETIQNETFKVEVLSKVRGTIDEILEEETPEVFEKMGITVLKGSATFHTPTSVVVSGTEYHFKTAVIATGSGPRPLAIPGLHESKLLTNQNLFELSKAPKRLLIIGAGPIGLEMSQAFAMLGSEVTLVNNSTEIASHEDVTIRPILLKSLQEFGVSMVNNANITHVENDQAFFEIKEDEKTSEIRIGFDYILLAIGRVPQIPEGLEAANIVYTQNGIAVNNQHRTSNKKIFAVGDVASRLKFTHTADDNGRQVVAHVASKGLLRGGKSKAVPKVTYTIPEIAQVGLSWEEAQRKYGENAILRIEVPFSKSDRAKTDKATDGVLVVLVKRISGKILGAHIIGPTAGEIITLFTLAIDENISMWKLQKLIYAYPTYSLIVKKAGDAFAGMQIGNLKSDILRITKQQLPKMVAGVFWLGLIYSFHNYRIENALSYQDMFFALLDFFTGTMYGPLVYMILYAIRPLILFPATILTALSGALFGFWWGVLYTVIGENASANFAYWIGRFFGKDLRLEETVIGSWIEKLRNNTFEAVLLMRLFYFPFDLTNYGSGVVKGKWREYFLATVIGIMPGLMTFVALGAALDLEEFKVNGFSFNAFDPKFLALSVVIFTLSIILSKKLKKKKGGLPTA